MRLALLLIPVLLSSSYSAFCDTWTSHSGATVEAEFVSLQGDMAVLKTSEGKSVRIRLNQLSSEDQVKVRQLASGSVQKEAVEDPVAAAPRELLDLFGDTLVDQKKKSVGSGVLAGKEKIGIYFSAHWCPPCRKFTPVLVDFYNELKKDGKPFELVFVSSDQDSKSMQHYMKDADMPWLAVPFKSKVRQALKDKFDVRGIPTLVVVNAKGETLTKSARGDVTSKGAAAFDKW
ncbi:MAG: redoxin family protein [Verrucomicrobia bacterium]|nr:redoxin family protein [Verrucomicrobiota bacterium]